MSSDFESKVNVFLCLQVRDLSVAYLLVGVTYLYVGVLIFAAFPSPPLYKDCIEPVRSTFKFSCLFVLVIFTLSVQCVCFRTHTVTLRRSDRTLPPFC